MTKKAIKMKDIILGHYQKVHELDMHGLTVRVWKPRTMQQLPAYNMLTVIDEYAENAEHWCATENFYVGCQNPIANFFEYAQKFVLWVGNGAVGANQNTNKQANDGANKCNKHCVANTLPQPSGVFNKNISHLFQKIHCGFLKD